MSYSAFPQTHPKIPQSETTFHPKFDRGFTNASCKLAANECSACYLMQCQSFNGVKIFSVSSATFLAQTDCTCPRHCGWQQLASTCASEYIRSRDSLWRRHGSLHFSGQKCVGLSDDRNDTRRYSYTNGTLSMTPARVPKEEVPSNVVA